MTPVPPASPTPRVVILTAAATAATTPVVRRAMLEFDLLDVPNHRSSHTRPIPRAGGLACLIGVAGGWIAAGTSRPGPRRSIPPLALTIVGLVDDRTRGLSPTSRLLTQLAVGIAAGTHALPRRTVIGVAAYPILVNVFNFMDGINGISASTATLWGFHAIAAGRHYGISDLPVIGALAAGAGIGFLPWNAPAASIFLGDSGSYLFGSLVASGLSTATSYRTAAIVAAPLALYFTDVTVTLVRRAVRGERLTEAHREHIYQRITSNDWRSHAQAVAAHSGLALVISRNTLRKRHPLLTATLGAAIYLATPWLARRLGVAS